MTFAKLPSIQSTVHVHMYILKGYINQKTETKQKVKLLDYIVLRKHLNPSTVQNIQLEYYSTQRVNGRLSRSKLFTFTRGDNNNYRSKKFFFFYVFPPSMHLYLIFKVICFLAKYFCFGIFKFSFLLLLLIIVGNAAVKQNGQPTSRQLCAKLTSFPQSHLFLPQKFFTLLEHLCLVFCTA